MLALALNLLADNHVVYTSSGLGVVILVILFILLWPVPDGSGPRVGLLWPLLLILLLLFVVGLL